MSGKRTHTMRNNIHKNKDNKSPKKRKTAKKLHFGKPTMTSVPRLYTPAMLSTLFQTDEQYIAARHSNKSREEHYVRRHKRLPPNKLHLANLTPAEFAYRKAKWIAKNVIKK